MIGNLISGAADSFLSPEPVGIGGFKAYATVNETVSGARMLPSSVLEDGSHAHDHIIIEPVRVEMNIVISDTYVNLEPSSPIFKGVDSALGAVTQFLPSRARSTIAKMDEIRTTIDQTIRRADSFLSAGANLFSLFGGAGVSNHRDAFVQALDSLYQSDALVTLETRHRLYENMALAEFDYMVDNERRAIEANLVFEQITFRSLITVSVERMQSNPAPAAAAMGTSGVAEKGTQSAKSGAQPKGREERSIIGALGSLFKR